MENVLYDGDFWNSKGEQLFLFPTLFYEFVFKHAFRFSFTSDESEDGCTIKKVKSCAKLFCAHLFSHVGLSAILVSVNSKSMWVTWSSLFLTLFQSPKFSYSLMGAFLFRHLESPYELAVRENVRGERLDTLEKLWGLTGDMRSLQRGLQMICGRWSWAKRSSWVNSERLWRRGKVCSTVVGLTEEKRSGFSCLW